MTVTDPFVVIAERITTGARLVRHWPLEGGVSASIDALEVALPDGTLQRVVVRRHGATDRTANPDVARDEYRLLTVLHAAGLPVPTPRLLTDTDDPFPEPCIVVDFVEGTTGVPPHRAHIAARRMADFLCALHAIDLRESGLVFLPSLEQRVERSLRQPLANAESESIRQPLADRWPQATTSTTAVLHGDFWPGNILWRDGTIAAVIDWEDAVIGDPLADLAKCRLELLWEFGEQVMDTFTDHYVAISSVATANLPFWELHSTLGPIEKLGTWGLDPEDEARMREKLHTYAERARATLLEER